MITIVACNQRQGAELARTGKGERIHQVTLALRVSVLNGQSVIGYPMDISSWTGYGLGFFGLDWISIS